MKKRNPSIQNPPSRKFIRIPLFFFMFLFLISWIVSCSSPYLKNRARDASDIFTFQVSDQTYGTSLRVGPLQGGVSYESPGANVLGLRGGEFGSYHTAGFTAILFGADYFQNEPFEDLTYESKILKSEKGIEGTEKTDEAMGSQDSKTDAADATKSERKIRLKLYRARSPFGLQQPAYQTRRVWKSEFGKPEPDYAPRSYFTDLQFSAGLYYGIRLGINPGELADFLIGFTTLDLMDDDMPINEMERKLRSHPLYDFLDDDGKRELKKALENGTLMLPD